MTAEHTIIPPVSADPRRLYLDLLKKSLMCSLYEDLDGSIGNPGPGLRPHAATNSSTPGTDKRTGAVTH